MSNYKLIYGGMLAATTLLLGAPNLFAEGRVVIEPKIHTDVQYNSNFWKAEDDEVGVNTYSIRPGVVLGYETQKSEIMADLSVDAYWYDDQDSPPAGVRDSSDDDFVGFTGSLTAESQVAKRLQLSIDESLMLTRDPASADDNSDSVSREKYTINRITPGMYYTLGTDFGLGLKYRNTYTDYTDDLGGEDNNEHRGILDFYYNLNRNAAIYLDYQLWNREYDETSSEYTSNKITLNYAHTFNFLSVVAGAGYHDRSFDVDGLEDIDMFTWNVGLLGEDKVEGNQQPRYWMNLSLGQNFNDSGTGDQYYIATKLTAEAGYRFFGKLETSAMFEFQNSDYQNHDENRDDDTITASAKVAYDILEFLTFGIEGGLKDRDSNITGKTYDDKFILALLNFDYNLGSR